MKDNFSDGSARYARYRPSYPDDIYNFIYSFIENRSNAWDCGTGSGQVARRLSEVFEKVYGTDISNEQLKNAFQAENIIYSRQPAEKVSFTDNFFDLIIVAQAVHWFDFGKFYHEVARTGRPGSIVAVIGYGRASISGETDGIISALYSNTLGTYWDIERKYIDEAYKTIPFPFEEISAPLSEIKQQWSLEHFSGYLKTWSAVKHFEKVNGYNPVDHVRKKLEGIWSNESHKEVRFPVFSRIGRIVKKHL